MRNLLKLFAERRLGVLGSKFRTRLVVVGLLQSFLPAIFMFWFSFGLLNRSIDRWFSQPTSELREDSTRVVLELAQYVTENARVEAESIAASGALDKDAPAPRGVERRPSRRAPTVSHGRVGGLHHRYTWQDAA